MKSFQYNLLPYTSNNDLLRVLNEAGGASWEFAAIIETPTQFQPGTILVQRAYTSQGGI